MSASPEQRTRAHTLARQAVRAQAAGNDAEAQQADAVAEVLAKHDAAHEPDARDQRTFDGDCPEQHAGTLRDRPRRTGA